QQQNAFDRLLVETVHQLLQHLVHQLTLDDLERVQVAQNLNAVVQLLCLVRNRVDVFGERQKTLHDRLEKVRSHLAAHVRVQNGDQQHVFQHHPVGGQRGGNDSLQDERRQGAVHVVARVLHVDMVQVDRYSVHVRFSQTVYLTLQLALEAHQLFLLLRVDRGRARCCFCFQLGSQVRRDILSSGCSMIFFDNIARFVPLPPVYILPCSFVAGGCF
uniref:Uncharacterized protein n=1 Tax=Anopheles atroparvus TaxID=41427 RepID=A0AAG5DRH1_ANOAO